MTAPAATGIAQARGYWLTALLILPAVASDLGSSGVFSWLTPLVARDLGVAVTDLTWASAIGSAALPLSVILVADLVRRVDGRTLFLWGLGLYLVGSALAAAAPSLLVLIVARFCASFAVFMMLLNLLPAFMTRYSDRIRTSIAIIVLSLAGTSAGGALVAGFFAQLGTWRGFFLLTLLLGLVALPLALAFVPSTKPSQPAAPVDWAACALGPAGIVLAYVGVTQLTWHPWGSPVVAAPVALGLACLAALVVAEAVQHEPLFPVRLLAHPVPALFLGVAIVASTVYSTFLAQLLAFLEQVRGLGEWDAAALFWPLVVGLVPAAALLALTFATRWLQRLVVLGGICYLVAAWQLGHIDAFTGDATVLLLAGLIGLGEGTTLFPAMFTIASSERAAGARIPSGVVRRLAFVQLVRFTLSYVGATTVDQWRGTGVKIRSAHLARQVSSSTLSALAARYVQHGATSAPAHAQAIQAQASVLALQDVGALLIVVILGSSVVLGLVALTTTPRVRSALSRIR